MKREKAELRRNLSGDSDSLGERKEHYEPTEQQAQR